jgi:hypothetical protein
MSKVVESGLSARPNAIGSGLENKPKSLQHEYECSFGSDVGPQNFEFSKKRDYKLHIKERMINEEQWEKIIGSGSAVIPNAFGSGFGN